jgi:hydrogenase-4 component F
MICWILWIPCVAGILSFGIRSNKIGRWILLTATIAHMLITLMFWIHKPQPAWHGALKLDSLGLLFLTVLSFLFLNVSLYTIQYLKNEPHELHPDFQNPYQFFKNTPESLFIGCLLFFLASMTLVTLAHDLNVLWIAVETTTISSAPLVYFHRHQRSLEATWKYLILCSVGIALALLGNFFIGIAAVVHGKLMASLSLGSLLSKAKILKKAWLRIAFIFFLVGYGTKMGLAPMHAWLPDAHSEAPSMISALLSGTLLNCSFLALLRIFVICEAAGVGIFAQKLFLIFGLISMGVAALFILGQKDYKRLLAYSSVEHMGILAFGIGVGSSAFFAVLFHVVCHSLTKAALFLIAGNILTVYHSKMILRVNGLAKRMPYSGILWIIGFLAITGMPPFGTFFSEFWILKAAVDHHQMIGVMLFLLFLSMIFIGMAWTFLNMFQGEVFETAHQERRWTYFPSAILLITVLILGLYLPMPLSQELQWAAHWLRSY